MTVIALQCATAEDHKYLADQFTATVAFDFGQIVNGEYYNQELRFASMNRNMVMLRQGASYGDHWDFSLGLMGIIWWPFSVGGVEPHERTIRVAPGVTEMRARLKFCPQDASSFLEFGYIPYRYNHDAQNLGEYLYRSGTYPGYLVTTDGFRLFDYTEYDAYGVHLQLSQFNSRLKHNFNLFLEPAVVPVGDLTPAYDFSWKFSIVEVGGGVAFNRYISFSPSLVQKKDLKNAYVEADTGGTGTTYYKGPFNGLPSSFKLKMELKDTSFHSQVLHYWTQKGIKAMGRVSVDLGFLLPEAYRNPGDLKVFSEVAVLGWEDQPFFYEKRSRRIPVMLGINIPTMKVLELLSFQVEHYAARFDNTKSYFENARPVWDVADYAAYDPAQFTRDDWKWSLYGERKINDILLLKFQVANDHLRLPLFNSTVSDKTLTLNPSHWYYTIRFEMGL